MSQSCFFYQNHIHEVTEVTAKKKKIALAQSLFLDNHHILYALLQFICFKKSFIFTLWLLDTEKRREESITVRDRCKCAGWAEFRENLQNTSCVCGSLMLSSKLCPSGHNHSWTQTNITLQRCFNRAGLVVFDWQTLYCFIWLYLFTTVDVCLKQNKSDSVFILSCYRPCTIMWKVCSHESQIHCKWFTALLY